MNNCICGMEHRTQYLGKCFLSCSTYSVYFFKIVNGEASLSFIPAKTPDIPAPITAKESVVVFQNSYALRVVAFWGGLIPRDVSERNVFIYWGSQGSPSTRSPMIFFWISSVPPAIDFAGVDTIFLQ